MKIFFEKHLTSTVLSLVIAIITFLMTSEDYWILAKIGKSLYLLLIFGLSFILIQFIQYISKILKRKKLSIQQDMFHQMVSEKEEKECKEKFLSFVDSLSPDDRNLIKEFIKSGNSPKVYDEFYCGTIDSILSIPEIIISTRNNNGTTSYKLKDEFYKAIRRIYEEQGRISHFE